MNDEDEEDEEEEEEEESRGMRNVVRVWFDLLICWVDLQATGSHISRDTCEREQRKVVGGGSGK